MEIVNYIVLLWFASGFIVSLKAVFLDKVHEEISKISDNELEQIKGSGSDKVMEVTLKLLTKKRTFIPVMTLLGFVSVWLDIKNIFKKEI